MKSSARLAPALLLMAVAIAAFPLDVGQQTGSTVRHHRVEEQEEDPVAAQLDQAEAAMQKQNYDAAEIILMKAVADNPQSYRAWFDLGYVYNATKRPADAVSAYRKSVAAKPDVFESNLNLGIVLARQGNTEVAVKYLMAATKLKPTANEEEGLARAWLSLGLVEEAGEPQQALDAYAQASKLTPFDPEPHLSAGRLLEKQEKFEDAAHEYEIAARLAPKATEPLAGLANVYSKQKKFAQAEAQLRALLAIEPANQNARAQLGTVLAAEGKPEEGAMALPADTSSNTDPRVALQLGSGYVKAGNYAAAEDQFRLAVQAYPDSAEAHFGLGSVLMEEKQYSEAQVELLLAAKLKPELAEVYGNLAVVAAANQNYTLSIRALEERAKYLPETPATYFLRATAYDNLKTTAKAVENYRRFLAADGGKMPDQEWQARHRLMAIDPGNASKYQEKKK
ncbi:MAG TPA: tetratricopeptide repeat protein [Candidatus Eisenbacteria bacterium]|nr:tetratricopeptide repeat protein [Candidatus Eisenbacteria bacterium]